MGAFLTWTSDGPVRLNGIQGPNNGWLVLILAALALGWSRSRSWIGVVGVLGAALLIGWTALENWLDSRDVFDSSARLGLVLVTGASIALAGAAGVRAVELVRLRTRK